MQTSFCRQVYLFTMRIEPGQERNATKTQTNLMENNESFGSLMIIGLVKCIQDAFCHVVHLKWTFLHRNF